MPMRRERQQAYTDKLDREIRRVQNKIKKYTELKNKQKLRRYKLDMWALQGLRVYNLQITIMLKVYKRYLKTEIVPTHYFQPEFYRL